LPDLHLREQARRETIRIEDEAVTIGRSAQNTIVVKDPRSSRRHCRIERHGDRYRVVDLGSQNGTFVNGTPVASRVLETGDRIEIGGARIFFDREPRESEGAGARTRVSGDVADDSGPDLERLLRERSNFLRLQRTTRAINSELDLEPLLEIILDAAVELTDAERGFLILREGEALRIRVARNLDRETIERPEFSISRSIAESVCRNGEPILTLNAQEDERFADTQSVDTLGLRSLLCVPFTVKDRVLGTVYLDNRLHKGVFSDEDLRLLETLADQAAIAIQNADLVGELRASKRSLDDLNRALEERVRNQSAELSEVRRILSSSSDDLGFKYRYENIVGRSRRMQEVFRLLDRVIDSEVPVFIHGESGTGKELVAKAIHFNGPRRERPFVSENCAALPETLLESELFGYVKGAFTGANTDKKGLFELAAKGTLFLDEVGNMGAEMQKKLLRVLQEREIRRVGGKDKIATDVRIISASNRDPKEMVAQGALREDLYFRLQVITVEIPPVRERREDIPRLVEHFLTKFCADEKRRPLAVPPEVMNRFLDYSWPGNVREIENEVRRIVTLADSEISLDLISPHIREGREQFRVEPSGPIRNLNALVEEVERLEILKALEHCRNNKTRAAEMLGISRFTLQRKLEKYGLHQRDAGGRGGDDPNDTDGEEPSGGEGSGAAEGGA
jgi:transcriptional regulator with GAF, ATPase, and Fis domain